ncbi:wax ester/triacylglycerol synthase domain-containing protein [Mycobacterium tilburgii]|uniref:wax ester/triacylglycerol synthase domain-containing protein n=1 Tax=Mycobacterium tilburgii TaxID=44467 RepID=UPI0028C44A92|nr:wax ester/triacylglycerol synthase domain-containing protein [Mycobacterium tilburgii]
MPHLGDEADLSRAIAHALERPLESDRPPSECWVIDGLTGTWTVLVKVHHQLAGAIPAVHLLTRLCDDADGGFFADPPVPELDPAPARKRGWFEALESASAVTKQPGRQHLVGGADIVGGLSRLRCAATASCVFRWPRWTRCAASAG